jgi:hypothetical protein
MDRYDTDPACARYYLQDRDRDAVAWRLARSGRKAHETPNDEHGAPVRSTPRWRVGVRLLQSLHSLR